MAATLESADDPNKSPPGEDKYLKVSVCGTTGLWDNISCSQVKRKGHSHQAIQQSTADTPTSAMLSVSIKTVPPTKVLIDDLVNFSLRPGSPNPLKVAAEGGKLSADLKRKRQSCPLTQC